VNPKADPVARGAVDRLRAKVLARGGRNGIRSLGKIFGQMDRNGNKRLDSEEVREALSLFGIPANPADIKIIMSAFDRDGDGSIDFEEFLRGMRGAMSKRRKRLVRKAFAVLDKTGDGEVTIDDLIGVYDVSKNPDVLAGRLTERQALEEFLSQWDKTDKDGVVTQAEFLEYYKDVSASIDDDDYFELMIRNAWHLSGGEGWSENTANKRVLITLSDGRQQVVEIINDLGIKKGDTAEMKKRLEAQGIKGIIAISENF
jgi:Ca2+-binding EF-hand superfamily protein